MSTLDTMIQDVLDRVVEYEQVWQENLEPHLKGVPFEQRRPNDEEFVAWFQLMMQRDPDWVRALPYVEGGTKELLRYVKLVGMYDPAIAKEAGYVG